MAENGSDPGANAELFDQTQEDTMEVRQIEPAVAAAELKQQVDLIKKQLTALDEAKRVPADALELVVSI